MNKETSELAEKLYESRLTWRRPRQIENYSEIIEATGLLAADPLKAFKVLFKPSSEDHRDALRWSILMMTYEATECYVYGEFQACVLAAGAVVERVLKLEYQVVHGTMPDKKGWPLGRCLFQLDWSTTRVGLDVIERAKEILDPRNSRAHALLEHSDPQLSIIGGDEHGVELLASGHALIEPYRGDAKRLLTLTYEILSLLYYSPESV